MENQFTSCLFDVWEAFEAIKIDAKIEFATINSFIVSVFNIELYGVSFYIALLISALRNSLGYSDLLSSLLILLYIYARLQ